MRMFPNGTQRLLTTGEALAQTVQSGPTDRFPHTPCPCHATAVHRSPTPARPRRHKEENRRSTTVASWRRQAMYEPTVIPCIYSLLRDDPTAHRCVGSIRSADPAASHLWPPSQQSLLLPILSFECYCIPCKADTFIRFMHKLT